MEEEPDYSNADTNIRNQGSQINQVNVVPPKETNKAPTTDPKEMETYELSDEKFGIMFLKKFTVQKKI